MEKIQFNTFSQSFFFPYETWKSNKENLDLVQNRNGPREAGEGKGTPTGAECQARDTEARKTGSSTSQCGEEGGRACTSRGVETQRREGRL